MRAITAASVTAVLLGSLLVPAAARADSAPVFITDDQGRALFLHGLDTAGAAKGPGGLPWITRDDVAREARDLGTNSVRYLVQWKNIEPSPGVYDDSYLAAVAERISWYREQGMHVVIDMHQDIFGPGTCGGNGAPSWAMITDGKVCKPQAQWELDYLQPAILNAFDNFWNHGGGHPELMDHYVAMFQHVAAYFAAEPAVLGYDLMNEPFGGRKTLAGFEATTLTAFYQRLVDAIRTVDQDKWIFVEPQSLGANQGLPSSLGAVRDPRGRVVFAPHEYPLAEDLGAGYTGAAKVAGKAELRLWEASTSRVARRLGVPVWLGEFGAITTAGQEDLADDETAMADRLLAGWAWWSNDPGGDGPWSGTAWTAIAAHLARPYPRAVAGTPTRVSVGPASLTVSWTRRSGVTGPTEVWLPASYGTAPLTTLTDPAGTYETAWNPATRVLSVWAGPATTTHTLTIDPTP